MSSRDRNLSALIAKIGFDQNAVDSRAAESAGPGLTAKFFAVDPNTSALDDVDFSVTPDAARIVDDVNYAGNAAFGLGGPNDMFAALFEGVLRIETAGEYTFNVQSDDIARLILGGEVIINDNIMGGATTKTVTRYLEAGDYELDLRYLDADNSQLLRLLWGGPDTNGVLTELTGANVFRSESGFVPIEKSYTAKERDKFEFEWIGTKVDKTTDEPAPAPQPDPAPAPQPDPAPAPQPDPAPAPQPDPAPAPQPDPAPAPQPDPAPAPQPDPAPAPQPDPAPAPQPDPAPAPQPDPAPAPQPDPAPAPQPDPAPAPQPAPTPPTAPEQNVDSSNGGSVATTSTAAGSYSVSGGRVTTLEVDNLDDVASIRIIDGPDHGNLTVNPDNTMALVLSMENDFTGVMNMRYEVTYENGSSQTFTDTVNVAPSTQQQGWGHGDHYMLETDANGQLVIETGENHREVYVSGSDEALSRADIAALEGLSADQITNQWLANNPQYGSSPDTALDADAGMGLFEAISGPLSPPSSNWLLFERGYEYARDGRWNLSGAEGEDALHPVHITSYGTGDRPVINDSVYALGASLDFVVFSEVSLNNGVDILDGNNMIFDHVDVSGNAGTAFVVQGFDNTAQNLTLRHSTIVDVYFPEHPIAGATSWAEGNAFTAGAFIHDTVGILIEGSLFDHNGWAPDYREDLSTAGGQPPQMFNHNLYLQYTTADVTLRDNVFMRGASFGAQARGGAYIEDNLFLDNNVATTFIGGDHRGAGPVGNFTLFADNVITSAGHRDADGAIGAISGGLWEAGGQQSTLVDNIIAHMADPNNPTEQAEKTTALYALRATQVAFYDDTIVHNWVGSGPNTFNTTGINTDGLDLGVLDATTIQIFTQQLLNDPNADIADLAAYLRANSGDLLDGVVDTDLIIDFFQTGFGLSIDGRVLAETLRFVPDALGDGIRWDNRLNWDTDDLPGTVAGDSVDLAGNWVIFGGNTTIADLDFGNGGTLNINNGKLTVTGTIQADGDTATLTVSNAGQIWMNGYAGQAALDLEVSNGRFVNTGLFDGQTNVDITGGDAILATDNADFILHDGSTLEITGDAADVGFDGENGGTAVLLLDDNATLVFDAENGALGNISEFRSGAFGDAPNVQSGVNLGDAALTLDLTGWTGTSETLIDVDELIGTLDTLNVTGLAGNQDAEVIINYDDDTVSLNIVSGSGQHSISTIGTESDAQNNDDLWAALNDGHGIYDIA